MKKTISSNEFRLRCLEIKCLQECLIGFEVENFILRYSEFTNGSLTVSWQERCHHVYQDMHYLRAVTTEYVLENLSKENAKELLYILDLIS